MFPSGRPTQLRPVKLVHLNHIHIEQNAANKGVQEDNKCTNEQTKTPFTNKTNVMRTDCNSHVNNYNNNSSDVVRAPVVTSRVEQNLQRWRAFGVNVNREYNTSSNNLTNKLRDALEANTAHSNNNNNIWSKNIERSRSSTTVDKGNDGNVKYKEEQYGCYKSQHNAPRSFLSSISFNNQTLDTHVTSNNTTEKIKETSEYHTSQNKESKQENEKALEVTSTITGSSTIIVANRELNNSTCNENENIEVSIDKDTNKHTSSSLREHLREVARKVAEDMERRKCGAPKANPKKMIFALSNFRQKKALEQKKQNELQRVQMEENYKTSNVDNNKKKKKQSNKNVVQEQTSSNGGQTLMTVNLKDMIESDSSKCTTTKNSIQENNMETSVIGNCESEIKSTSRSLLAEMEETSEQELVNDESTCEQETEEIMEILEEEQGKEEELLLEKEMQEQMTSNKTKKRTRQESKTTSDNKNKKSKLVTTNNNNNQKKKKKKKNKQNKATAAAADAARRFLHLQENISSSNNVKTNSKTNKGNSASMTNASVRWGSMDHNNVKESVKLIPYEMLEDTDVLYNDIERSLHDPDRIQAPPLYVGIMFHKYLPKSQNSLLAGVNMNAHHDMLTDNTKSRDECTHDSEYKDGNGNSLLSKWFKTSFNSNNNITCDAAEEEQKTSTRKNKTNEVSKETDVLTNFSLSAKSSGKAHFVSTVDPRYAHKAVKYFVLRWKDKVYVLQNAFSQSSENGFTFILRVLHSLPGVEVITFAAPTLLLPLLCYTAGTLETSCVSDVRLMAWMVHIVDHEKTIQLHHQRTSNNNNNNNNNKEENEEEMQEEEAKISDYSVLQRICLGREASHFMCNSPLQQLVHEVYYLAPLYRVLYGQLGTQALLQAFLRQEKRLSLILTSMKMCGVIVDLAHVHRFKISCTAQMQLIREEAASFVPSLHDFNIQSHDHCRQAIYEILGLGRYLLDDNGITASSVSITRCGKLSTAEETLKHLAKHHPFPQLLLNYRKVAKLLQTYVEGMMSFAIPCLESEALSEVGLTAKHIANAQLNSASGEANENTSSAVDNNNNIHLQDVNYKCSTDNETSDDLFNDDRLLVAEESNNNNNNKTSNKSTPVKSRSRQRSCSCHSSPNKNNNNNSNNNNNNNKSKNNNNMRSGLYFCKLLPTSGLARIHANFLQESTDTGRLSCVEPNLQNLPRNAIMMEEFQQEQETNHSNESNLAEFDFRRCFVAPHGFTLLSVDYQQIELRVLAHLCEDQRLVLAMTNSTDIHRGIAQVIFNKSTISDEERNFSKRVVFGVIYGAGARTVALQTNRTVAEAEQILGMLKTAFPQMEVYRQRVIECARHDGFVRTISGRRRYLPEINSNHPMKRTTAERQAFNTVVQGSAADVMKMAMLAIEKDVIRHYRHKVYLLTQIHDEVVFAVQKKHIAHVVRGITHAMSHALSMLVPLTVTAKVGPSLGQLEEWSVDHELGVKTVM